MVSIVAFGQDSNGNPTGGSVPYGADTLAYLQGEPSPEGSSETGEESAPAADDIDI